MTSAQPPPEQADLDPTSRRWLTDLAATSPRHHQAVSELHHILLKAARHELARRRTQLRAVSGPEFDDLADQAANDALISILDRLDRFQGLSRFTTWAYKFVIFEVSGKVARHAWQRQPPTPDELAWHGLPDSLALGPDAQVQQREQLDALTVAIGQLSDRQRETFVAIALNDVPIDVLVAHLDSNRNAVYKNLFDARRELRRRMAEQGHPVEAISTRT